MDYQQLLKDKRVFITTGARGIGKAIALLFAQQGAVVAVGGRNKAALVETERELRSINPKCLGLVCDLSHSEETENVCKKLWELMGRCGHPRNAVGINHHCTAHLYSDELMEQLLETNYKSGLRCMRCFMPGMLERGYGNIINISSIHSEMSMPGYLVYAGTKGSHGTPLRG